MKKKLGVLLGSITLGVVIMAGYYHVTKLTSAKASQASSSLTNDLQNQAVAADMQPLEDISNGLEKAIALVKSFAAKAGTGQQKSLKQIVQELECVLKQVHAINPTHGGNTPVQCNMGN